MTNSAQTFLAPAMDAFSRAYRRTMQLLGRQAVEQSEPVKSLSDLCLARAERRLQAYADTGLPEKLLQAFTSEALAAGDARFIGREEQLGRLSAAIEKWRNGRSTMVAVTGPQGCGISSLLQQLSHLAGGEEHCRYSRLTGRPYDVNDTLALLGSIVGCEQPITTVDQLLEYINALPPGVFAIDNGHYLACRVMGAHEAIRTFGAVMVATQQRHLWVLGCEEFAWRRLTYIYRADRNFTDRIELPLFSEAELGQCIASRLQVSAADAGSGDSEAMAAMLARELPALCRLSNGKPDLAFFYFLGALRVNAETGLLELQTAVALDFSALKQLIGEELFTLAEVTAHGRLTIDEHRAVFRCGHDQSWLLLDRLCHQCLLDRVEIGTDVAYRLQPLYSDVITRFLTNTNYLY